MRVRNKELRERRHRKEQRIKELIAIAKVEAKSGNKPKGAKAPVAKKAATPKPVAEVSVDRPKRTSKKKDAEETAAPAE